MHCTRYSVVNVGVPASSVHTKAGDILHDTHTWILKQRYLEPGNKVVVPPHRNWRNKH